MDEYYEDLNEMLEEYPEILLQYKYESNKEVEDKHFTVKIRGFSKENDFNISIPQIRVETIDGNPAINFDVDDMSLDCKDPNLEKYLLTLPHLFHEWVLKICKNL